MECKIEGNRRYCKINGQWVKMEEEYKFREGRPEKGMEISKPIRTKRGVC